MRDRISKEISLLRAKYEKIQHDERDGIDWIKLPSYSVPEGWRVDGQLTDAIPIVFSVPSTYPGTPPYAFLAPASINFNGSTPANTTKAPEHHPFQGEWVQFSWSVANWAASVELTKGSNLLAWCRSFRTRFEEGI